MKKRFKTSFTIFGTDVRVTARIDIGPQFVVGFGIMETQNRKKYKTGIYNLTLGLLCLIIDIDIQW